MSYTIIVDPAAQTEANLDIAERVESCDQAKRDCAPAYVFSVEGQVQFRGALDHLSQCRRRQCGNLKQLVSGGMREKLLWLFEEHVLLGCVHVQPHLYGSRRVIFNRQQFPPTADHLSKCPKESCAQLRRALMLSVRDMLRPS